MLNICRRAEIQTNFTNICIYLRCGYPPGIYTSPSAEPELYSTTSTFNILILVKKPIMLQGFIFLLNTYSDVKDPNQYNWIHTRGCYYFNCKRFLQLTLQLQSSTSCIDNVSATLCRYLEQRIATKWELKVRSQTWFCTEVWSCSPSQLHINKLPTPHSTCN